MIDVSAQASSVRSAIVQHNRLMQVATPAGCVCQSCQATGTLRRKDSRSRQLRFWEEWGPARQLAVVSLTVSLVRWRCTACGFTATHYPDFRPALQAVRGNRSVTACQAIPG